LLIKSALTISTGFAPEKQHGYITPQFSEWQSGAQCDACASSPAALGRSRHYADNCRMPGGARMNIASLVLRAQPFRLADLQQAVASIPGSEIHAVSHANGCMIVTVEDTPGLACEDALVKMQELDHILSVTLAYEYSD
jgi:periplasmic nitrate reductase NapD